MRTNKVLCKTNFFYDKIPETEAAVGVWCTFPHMERKVSKFYSIRNGRTRKKKHRYINTILFFYNPLTNMTDCSDNSSVIVVSKRQPHHYKRSLPCWNLMSYGTPILLPLFLYTQVSDTDLYYRLQSSDGFHLGLRLHFVIFRNITKCKVNRNSWRYCIAL